MREETAMAPLSITATDSLADAMHKTHSLDFGGTDCALPMLDALGKKIPVDCFVILTDSETWAGPVHPAEALRKYRQEMGIPAKLVVVAMVANEFTIADPEDAGMMDVVGFDSAAPALIADFAKTLDTETLALESSAAFRTPTLVGCYQSQRMSRPRTSATRTTSKPTEVQDA